ncbi:MAG: SAM-dependent methyltransferase [Cyclobacteriaceae bacterium]|nr:SAM-dependent methyltransferase [Cyclobacteriaceae bacterium]
MMAAKGRLFLIPNVISEATEDVVIPIGVKTVLKDLSYFLAEDIRTARRYLSSLKIYPAIEALQFEVLNKDTSLQDLSQLMQPIMEGHDIGVLSESGCPGIADPGALAIEYAHQQNIRVVPLVGPSSILLALIASGLNGQQFAFHGYLPIDAKEAQQKIRELERESKAKNQTQIFIETPYRNNSVFDHFLKSLHTDTRLTIALDLTGKNEVVQTRSINQWKKIKFNWAKSPAVFLFLA